MKNIMKMHSINDFKQAIESQIQKRKSEENPVLTVSAGTCGRARGSLKVIKALKNAIKKKKLEDKVKVKVTGCHGFCEAEPNIIIHPHNIFYQKIEPKNAKDIIAQTILNNKIIEQLLYFNPITKEKYIQENDIPFYKHQKRIILGDNALIDPKDVNDYLSIGGYSSLIKVLSKMSSEEVINAVKQSGLRGRGGAGFPTGSKWEFTRKANGNTKFIICNADEGDPGAYMDRSLLEGNPHRVLEGMLIGAYAIGAEEGYIYVRGEYPLAVEHISLAISQAKKLGLLGKSILGTSFNFQIHISKGAGAFVCGEETALITSIEGKVGEPRQRPPFPAVKGLWGKPTNINNVETWANIPVIIEKGADWYSKIGINGSKGTKIFSLVGKINNTGLVEVPIGITLREIIYDIGGGIPAGKNFKAVQTGGPSGGCIPAELLDLQVDYEKLAEAGSIMGSGGMIVMDENTCMVDLAKYFLNFLRDESCGKCLSCREGIQRLWEILTDITEGRATREQLDLVEELARIVKDASMCGLGQTASNPVLSTLRYFRDEYEVHIRDKWCPALVCKRLIPTPCQDTCPVGIDVPSYIGLIARGKFNEAVDLIREDNPFPAICGRVCNHPCELNCKMGEFDKPVAIHSLKRFCADYVFQNEGYKRPSIQGKREERVAVIGSGPAGLTAAYNLAQLGYRTNVFEALPVAGGMLSVGIPAYRLPKEIVKAEIDAICALGVEIKTNTPIGKDLSIDDLKQQGYKAIFIATGAHKSLKLGLPREDGLKGIIDCVAFLKDVNLGNQKKPGDKIVIVGDDYIAVDTARVCRRLGSSEVNIIYKRSKEEMPLDDSEIDQALDEGVKIHFLTIPCKILGKEGKVTGLQCIHTQLGEADIRSRRDLITVEGSEFVIDADIIIRAAGQAPDLAFLDHMFEITQSNLLSIDPCTLQTNVPGVFAGGDAVTGPATVIEAIAAGKKAAASIDSYIRGKKFEGYKRPRPRMRIEPIQLTKEEEELKRPEMPLLSVDKRLQSFEEVELGYTEEMAICEAKRCRRCDLEK
ncbi:MAG: NADH-quinone oxidoreductase subunit NuoF [Candidatus Aminicenantaceae bacterium]